MTITGTNAKRSAAALLCLAAACCTSPAPTPPPAPSPAPAPAPPPPPPPSQPVYDDQTWMDAPQTPGDWTYVAEANETLALFGTSPAAAVLVLRCDPATRQVGIARPGQVAGQTQMRILTETAARAFVANPVGNSARPMVAAILPANDRFLEAMAFSKGRFAVETQGLNTLYVPAWPEVTRVIEDCR